MLIETKGNPPASAPSTSSRSTAPLPRVASLLPGLTDLLADLGLTPALVASSHECDLQADPVTRPALPLPPDLPSSQIAAGWSASLSSPCSTPLDTLARRICSFYHVDPRRLAAARPAVLLTHLAAPRHGEPDVAQVRAALHTLIPSLRVVLSAECRTLRDVYALHHSVAQVMRRPHAAVELVAAARTRLRSLRIRAGVARKKVAIVQWADPLYLAGDWVPGVVEIGGGLEDGFAREGGPSVAVRARDLRATDVVIFAICAMGLEGCRRVVDAFWKQSGGELEGWDGAIIVTDATKLFSRVAIGTVVQSAEVVFEVLSGRAEFGHKGLLWENWKRP